MRKAKNTVVNPVNSFPQNKNNKTKCPDCESELYVPCHIEKGEILSCPGCGLNSKLKK
jgi:transcription elongation factor Elf1